MTTTRKSTPKKKASATNSRKKGSSSRIEKKLKKPIKRRTKPKLLPAGTYNCTIDSLVGTKMTLNVNDLTLKDTVKLGLTLKIQPDEPKLHPEGTFEGVISDIQAPRDSTTGRFIFSPMTIETEHGRVFAYLHFATLDTAQFIYKLRNMLIGEYVKITVKHRTGITPRYPESRKPDKFVEVRFKF